MLAPRLAFAAALLLPGPARADDRLASASSGFFDGNGARGGLGSGLALPPPPKAPDAENAHLLVRLYDGARRPLPASTAVFLRVFDGNQKDRLSRYLRGPEILVQGLPFSDNFADDYRVIAWASGLEQAGYSPVPLKKGKVETLDLMLPPSKAGFDFSRASYDAIAAANPELGRLLAANTSDPSGRWRKLQQEKPEAAACLLNIAEALRHVGLAGHNPLSDIEFIIWDERMQRDRFWAHVELELLEEIRRDKRFKRISGEGLFHPGAVESYKQIEFENGNVQITFHPAERSVIAGHEHILVELDIDLYKDLLAHGLLEVLPNGMRHGQTDPRRVFQLRWIAGRRAGAPEFDPLYDLR